MYVSFFFVNFFFANCIFLFVCLGKSFTSTPDLGGVPRSLGRLLVIFSIATPLLERKQHRERISEQFLGTQPVNTNQGNARLKLGESCGHSFTSNWPLGNFIIRASFEFISFPV